MLHYGEKMTSEALQEAFPDLYRELFSRCSIVCSTPRAYAITGDHTVPYGGMALIQRAPLRNYVGLEPTKERGVRLAQQRRHIPDKSFIDHDFSRLFDERIAPVLEEFLRAHPCEHPGFAVHVYTEGPPPRITGGYGGIVAALSATFHRVVGLVSSESLSRWASTPTRTLLTDTSLSFDTVFRFALKLKTALDLSVEGGGIVFASYLTSSAPTLFYWQKTLFELSDVFPPSLQGLTVEQATKAFEHVPYWGCNIDELIAPRSKLPFTWPIDTATVNVGKVVSAGYAQRMLVELESNFRHFGDVLDAELEPLLLRGDPLPGVYRLSKERGGQSLWEMVHHFSMKLSATTIVQYLRMCTHTMGDKALNDFLRSADTYRHWLNILDFNIPVQNHLAIRLHERAFEMNIPIAVKPFAYGGEVLIMTPISVYRDALSEEIERFKRDTGVLVTVDYASWRDGYERRGLVVDQDAESGRIARLFGSDVETLLIWNARGGHRRALASHEQMMQEQTHADIFLDSEEKKIYVQGKLLSSRELHSARKTIEILTVLLHHGGEWVSADGFLPSSYIDRNEMQSKIVSPFCAAVEKRLKKSVAFDIQGPVGQKFSLRLKPRGVRIVMRLARS